MNEWYMLTLVGEDRPGIVAAITAALFDRGMCLGEASMLRLGGNFSMLIMVSGAKGAGEVETVVRPIAQDMRLHVHVDRISGGLHRHMVPNLHVTVTGADRAGIVAQVTGALAAVGFNILDLASDVAGTTEEPLYIMQIDGVTDIPWEEIEAAVSGLRAQGIEVHVAPIETMVG